MGGEVAPGTRPPELNRATQEIFSPFPHRRGLCLNVHMHDNAPSRTLVVFVHGRWGRGYRTWGKFPALVFADADLQADVGVVDQYGLQSPVNGSSALTVANQIADEIDTSRYQSVILIGHSLGGAVSLLVAKRLNERSRSNGTRLHLRGVFLLATPSVAARRGRFEAAIRRLLSQDTLDWQSKDGITDYIAANLETSLETGPRSEQDTARLPLFVATAIGDLGIPQLDAHLDVPKSQANRFWASHTSIAKPRDANAPVFRWVRQMLLKLQGD